MRIVAGLRNSTCHDAALLLLMGELLLPLMGQEKSISIPVRSRAVRGWAAETRPSRLYGPPLRSSGYGLLLAGVLTWCLFSLRPRHSTVIARVPRAVVASCSHAALDCQHSPVYDVSLPRLVPPYVAECGRCHSDLVECGCALLWWCAWRWSLSKWDLLRLDLALGWLDYVGVGS